MKSLWILLAVSPLWAGDLRTDVLDLLNAYEESATPAQLAALGDVGPTLLEIAQDAEVAASRRGRAVTALGYFPSDTALAWLGETLGDASGQSYLRRKTCTALVRGWGEAAVGALGGALADEDTQLRIAAAEALGSLGGEAATTALQERLAIESNEAVTEAVNKALETAR